MSLHVSAIFTKKVHPSGNLRRGDLDWNLAELEMFVSEESTIVHAPEWIFQLDAASATHKTDGNNGCSAKPLVEIWL